MFSLVVLHVPEPSYSPHDSCFTIRFAAVARDVRSRCRRGRREKILSDIPDGGNDAQLSDQPSSRSTPYWSDHRRRRPRGRQGAGAAGAGRSGRQPVNTNSRKNQGRDVQGQSGGSRASTHRAAIRSPEHTAPVRFTLDQRDLRAGLSHHQPPIQPTDQPHPAPKLGQNDDSSGSEMKGRAPYRKVTLPRKDSARNAQVRDALPDARQVGRRPTTTS